MNTAKHIILTVEGRHLVTLDPGQIIRCEGCLCYTIVYLKDARYTVCKNLSKVEQALRDLPIPFVRVHQSHLVNLNYVSDIRKYKQWEITMSDSSSITVSKRRQKHLIQHLDQHYIRL